MAFDFSSIIFPKRKIPIHELKWKLPEGRMVAPIEDIEKKIPLIKKQAAFVFGGEFIEEIHAKEYGEGVYAYFILRTDKKTEKEQLVADAYMLREEEKLGMEVGSAYTVAQNLETMGYKYAFNRDVTVWSFRMGLITVNAYSIADFGDFIEVSLPATKLMKQREMDEKKAYLFFEKMGVKKEEVIPTDLITLQIYSLKQQAEGQQ